MKIISIEKIDEGQRIDKFLKKEFPSMPSSFLYKMFRKKDIKVNNKHVKESYIISCNDIINIYLTKEQEEDFSKKINNSTYTKNINIIYEDENILLINKDRGDLVHEDKNDKRYVLQNYVIQYLKETNKYNNNSNYKPSPSNRIDRNTSGIVVFSKNFNASKEMMPILGDKDKVIKYYLALTFNEAKESDVISKKLIKNNKYNTVYVDENNGVDAKTSYKKLTGNDKFSLLLVRLYTGRTHQIRVHLSSVGLPIVGDEKYGDYKKNKEIYKNFVFDKQFLHSYSISFNSISGFFSYLNNLTFTASLPEEMKDFLNKIDLKRPD